MSDPAKDNYQERMDHRRAMGNGWVICLQCGGKLYDSDSTIDRAIPCPKLKPNGKCGYDE